MFSESCVSSVQTRVCKVCLSEKSLSEFRIYKSKTRSYAKDARKPLCLDCEKARARAYNAKDPEKNRARCRRRRNENPEAAREAYRKWRSANLEYEMGRARAWKAAHPEAVRRQAAAWREANPDKAKEMQRVYLRNRRARKRAAGGKITHKQWLERLAEFNWCCAYCLKRLSPNKATQDHFWPVARGGRHDLENVVPACFSCNARKSDSLIFDWVPRLLNAVDVPQPQASLGTLLSP